MWASPKVWMNSPGAITTYLGNHQGQQCIGGNIEREPPGKYRRCAGRADRRICHQPRRIGKRHGRAAGPPFPQPHYRQRTLRYPAGPRDSRQRPSSGGYPDCFSVSWSTLSLIWSIPSLFQLRHWWPYTGPKSPFSSAHSFQIRTPFSCR